MRAGRKRKTGERFACGKLRVDPEELQRRMTPREAPPPDHGTPELCERRRAVWGHPHAQGELECIVDLMRSKFTDEQYWAARIARNTYARYCAAIMAPRIVSGMLRSYIQGGGVSSFPEESAIEAVKRYQDIILAVRRYSFRSLKEVERLMRGSPPRNLDALRVGLTALADHLRFEERKAA